MKKIIIRLNKNFYTREVIEETISDFKDFCSGKIINNKFEVELKTEKSIDALEHEFCNYALGLMKNKSLI